MSDFPCGKGVYGMSDYGCQYRTKGSDGGGCSACTEDEAGCRHHTIEWAGEDGHYVHKRPDSCMIWQRARADAAEKRVAELVQVLCSGQRTEDMPEVCPFFVEPSDATPFGPSTGGCRLGRAVVLPEDNSKAGPILYRIGTIDEEQARLIWCHCFSGAQFPDKPNPDFVRCWRYWRAQFAAGMRGDALRAHEERKET